MLLDTFSGPKCILDKKNKGNPVLFFHSSNSRKQSAKHVKETKNAVCQPTAVMGTVQTAEIGVRTVLPGQHAAHNPVMKAVLLAWGSAINLHWMHAVTKVSTPVDAVPEQMVILGQESDGT